jgi:hypothetical protein
MQLLELVFKLSEIHLCISRLKWWDYMTRIALKVVEFLVSSTANSSSDRTAGQTFIGGNGLPQAHYLPGHALCRIST